MLFELCMFALVLATALMVAQVMAILLMVHIMGSKKAMVKYAKMTKNACEVLTDEFEEKDGEI